MGLLASIPAALNSVLHKANTVRLIKYKLHYITSLLKPSSGFPSGKNQIQIFAMVRKTPRDQPSANILKLTSHHLPYSSSSQWAFSELLQQAKFPLTLGPLHLLFSYLSCFPNGDRAGSLSSFRSQLKQHFLRAPPTIAPFKALL